MANPFLILVTVILTLAIIAGSIYVLVYFQHPEDKNVAWGPKFVVVIGLSLACFSILMLPLDVGNSDTNGGFPMHTLWQVVYIMMAAMAVVIVPFAMFYYEGEEYDETGQADSQLGYAIKGTLITFLVFAVVTVIMYLFLGIAEIPVVILQGTLVTTVNRTAPLDNSTYAELHNFTLTNFTEEQPYACHEFNRSEVNTSYSSGSTTTGGLSSTTGSTTGSGSAGGGSLGDHNYTVYYNVCYYYDPAYPTDNDTLYYIHRARSQIRFRVTFVLYIITTIVFFGWFLFILFGGIGMVAFPMDCINTWRQRPIRMSLDKYLTRKKEIGAQATQLIEKGKAIQEKQKRGRERKRDRRNYNKFRQAVFMLEEDYAHLQECYKRQGGKVILYFLTGVLGIFSACLTIIWLLHIILYMFTQPYPISPFLNTMFIKLDDAFGLLGTVAYGIFSFYLLLCVIKGNFKFGMRMFFLFPIHPMRVGGTLMNAFLFNTALILISAFSVTQFCTTAFSSYTSSTAINSLFALSVTDMMGLKYIFIGYVYAIFIMVFLTAIYFVIKPKDKPAINDIHI